MTDQTTVEEWHACRLLIRIGTYILTPGIAFGLVGLYLSVQYKPVLYLLAGLIITGIVLLAGGYGCKLAWKRKYTSKA
ncbi:MAG TPA: hypothetical protein VFE98_02780 [Candidatus Bathyarchaeia archaeon]|nr:hypothetical protein [Candidatus Bathyarchaeia archaeon]